MIISASRRTDIPAHFSTWFFNRIKEGFVLVRNPVNTHQISRVELSPKVVDGIVFWTKNPLPMLDRLDELRDYNYYFQFTITPYGKDIEPNLPSKNDEILTTFKRLSNLIGPDRVIWRYDPILISERYSIDYHIRAFNKIADTLHDNTRKVTISFVDTEYRGVKNNIRDLALSEFPISDQVDIGARLAEIAHSYGLSIDTCAESIDLQQFGVEHARCIDGNLFEKLLGCPLNVGKDKSQRLECGCVASIDIGMYNTCLNGCRYCYANYSINTVVENYAKHDPLAPLISGEVEEGDRVNDRNVKSCCTAQIQLGSL